MIELNSEILNKLSSKGVLAYVAVSLAGSVEATTAALAAFVRCQTAVMKEGLQELAITSPDIVRPAKRKSWWVCNNGDSEVQILDSSDYRLLVDDLKKYWDYLNPTIPFQMGSFDGAAINRAIRSYRWDQESWRAALKNRIISVVRYGHAPRTEPIYKWIIKLQTYLGGPVNEYGKPVESAGKFGQAISVEEQNRLARESYLSGQARG